jgi:hypothetical protein
MVQEKILVWGLKRRKNLQSQKQNLGPKISIDWKFKWSKKKYTFGGQRGENKPSEPKNGI